MTDIEIPWGPSGTVVYNRTYSRTKPDGSKETWPDTVRRVAQGNLSLVYGPMDTWHEGVLAEYDALVEMMDRFAIIPAGRHLWASGVRGRQYLFNCHVSGWGEKLSDHFEFSFLRLMEGGGVGANYSSRYLTPYGPPRRKLKVHVVCDPAHPDYAEMEEQGLLSHDYHYEWEGAFPVEDSREGWSAALVDLLDTYMTDDEVHHENRVYDVSRVRSKGQPLRTFGGVASGPAPFARMMNEVGKVMNVAGTEGRIYPTAAMEIDHAIAECVVSGGNRRSARMAIVHWADPSIIEFINCKRDSGKHWTTNISIEIDDRFIDALHDDAHPDHYFATKVHQLATEAMLTNGEPGYWNSSLSNVGEPNEVIATNPCQPSWARVITPDGVRTMGDIEPGDNIWSEDGWVTVIDKWSTGVKPVFRYHTTTGYVDATDNHRIVQRGVKVELADASGIDRLAGPSASVTPLDARVVADGLLLGDGYRHGASGGRPFLCVGANDSDYFDSEVAVLFTGQRSGDYGHAIETTLTDDEFAGRVFDRRIPERYITGTVSDRASVLRGIFSANGSICGKRVTLKTTGYELMRDVQLVLSSLGIASYYTTNKPSKIQWSNGLYESRESYDLNIGTVDDVRRFADLIGFIQKYKTVKVESILSETAARSHRVLTSDIRHIEPMGEHEVFDITVSGDSHTYWSAGQNVSNCGEIALEAWENCFDGDQEVITRYGVMKLRDLAGKTVSVLHDGAWHEAVGNSFGVQSVNTFQFAPARPTTGKGWQRTRADYRRDVIATPDHRWDTLNRGVVTDLRPGDVVASDTWSEWDESAKDYREGFVHGLIYGDGSLASANDKTSKFRVRLFGAKADHASRFEHVTYPEKAGCPEGWVETDRNLKALPLGWGARAAGFLAGWIATDGTLKPNGSVAISTINPEAVEWLERHAASLGWTVRGVSTHSGETNYGPRSAPLHIVTLARSGEWIVESVEELDEREVFCLTVPGVERFTLASGIRTMNCNLGHINLDAFAPKVRGEQPDMPGIALAHELMTRFLIRATYGDVNDPKQAEKLARNRRIGVGHLGVQGFLAKNGIPYSEAPQAVQFHELLKACQALVELSARQYAFELRIPEPVKTTTVAPTGSIAKLPGVTEGIHPIYARHFLRRVRFSSADPDQLATVEAARAEGFDVEVDQYDPSGNTLIVVYPTKDKLVAEVEDMGFPSEIVESADQIDLVDMLAFQAMYQKFYANNAISMTVNVPEGKVTQAELADALAEYLPLLKGTTIMVDGTRPQAPYTRITEAEFDLYEYIRVEDGTDEDCSSGACPAR